MKKKIKSVITKRVHRHCQRCEWDWYTKKARNAVCPNPECHSPYWDVPRKTKKRKEYGVDDEV